jgi:hypothetical protein
MTGTGVCVESEGGAEPRCELQGKRWTVSRAGARRAQVWEGASARP